MLIIYLTQEFSTSAEGTGTFFSFDSRFTGKFTIFRSSDFSIKKTQQQCFEGIPVLCTNTHLNKVTLQSCTVLAFKSLAVHAHQ